MIPEGAITNGAGQVAVKWILNRPAKAVKIDGTDRYYAPTYKLNVAMYWINPEDLDKILAVREKTCNCNNGTFQNAFVLANQIDYNLHKCGNRHCD